MEQEKLINEKRIWLFEQIKSEYAARAKSNRVIFWIFCAIFGIFLIQGVLQLTGVIEPLGIKEDLSYFIFYAALFISALYSMFASNKMAKAETPEGLLVTYDKNKKIGVWVFVVVIALFVISDFLKYGFSSTHTFISWLILVCILMVLLVAYNRNNQIKKLRELVQQS